MLKPMDERDQILSTEIGYLNGSHYTRNPFVYGTQRLNSKTFIFQPLLMSKDRKTTHVSHYDPTCQQVSFSSAG